MELNQKPTRAFVMASWAATGIGVATYLVGLWNATALALSEKGFYIAVLTLGLYATISLSKAVRDKADGIPVTAAYLSISWAAFGIACALLVVGLWNAEVLLSEKGFYGLGFCLSIFGAMAVQKNMRDGDGDLSMPSLKRATED